MATKRVNRPKNKAAAGLSLKPKEDAAITAQINQATDEWRASQGLPPIDRATGERSHPAEGFPR